MGHGTDRGLEPDQELLQLYTMDRLAQAAAIRAFEDDDYYRGINRKIITERERFKETLRKMGIPCTDSKSILLF